MEIEKIDNWTTLIYPLGRDKYKNMPCIGVGSDHIFMNGSVLDMSSREQVEILIEALETALELMGQKK